MLLIATPSYGYGGESAFGDFSRMNKRRRVDDGGTSWEASQMPEPRYAAVDQYNGIVPSGNNGESSHAAPLPQQQQQQPMQPWSSGVNLGASPYGDGASSSYAQPYFYQATDPTTYTSTWPATDGGAAVNYTSTTTYPSGGDMPYFPPSTEQAPANYDAVTTYQSVPAAQNDQYPYVDQQVQTSAPTTSAAAFYQEDASMHLKLQSMPILDNLATQLIHTIAKASYPQIQDLMRGNETEEGQAYITLKNLFDQTRKVYSRETPFIDAIAIQMFQPNQQELIRKANIATFVSSILGAHDVSFFHLNEYFMETFVPSGHRLLKWQGAIYLELKTQTYISAIMNSDGSPEAMLDELFPGDLDALILTRHPDAPSLSPSEQDFIDRCKARKNYLLAEPSTEDAVHELPKKYQWIDFVREFASCISKNVDGIMNVQVRSQAAFGGTAEKKGAANTDSTQKPATKSSTGATIPTLARQSSSTNTEKKAAPSSTIRQPWTKPEEDALLLGLEKVNGPHWSQILAIYGRGGSTSEVLKDRNQVQLKDKARNLKLWYLKMGKDVPVALRGVTGELRKRGGARARAALGLLDDEPEEVEGENLDPDLGQQQQQQQRPAKKKKSGKK
ncbi:TTAGGG repeat binding factor [Elasticomyces elasticus]|nr:TTAGGG repeat binding factor [Elasticomyces elasticus]